MPCTTILVGKNASYDGSTIIARNEDEASGKFTPKRMQAVLPADQPRVYRSVISHLEIDLSDLTPQRYSSVPDALGTDGIWAAAGVNECDVAMTATETITSNERVLGADPLVRYTPAQGTAGEEGYRGIHPARSALLIGLAVNLLVSAHTSSNSCRAIASSCNILSMASASVTSSRVDGTPATPFRRASIHISMCSSISKWQA